MWARILEDNKIKVYPQLPNKYVEGGMNVAGGFANLPAEIHRQAGFYPIVEPELGENERLAEMYFDEQNEVFTYHVYQLSAYEIAMREWEAPEYSKRIVASSDLIDMYPSVAIWFQLNGLPMILNEDGTQVRLYLNEIKPQHQELFNILTQAGEIQLENRPEEEDYI